MAREELARFLSEYLPRHPEVKAALDQLAGEELIAAAVQVGARSNHAFNDEEFRELMRAAATRRFGAGELSEQQLEAVAGGQKSAGSGQTYLVIKLTDCVIKSW